MTDTLDSTTPSTADTMNLFTADFLLTGTQIYGQVIKLRDNISRNSDGTFISYDDMFARISAEVDDLPTLELQVDVPAGQEGAYQRQLLHALEKINDDHDRVLRKVVKLKSRLLNAINLMDMQRSQFAAYFSLAIPVAIHTGSLPPKTKISAAHSKEMAGAEYSHMMDRLDYLAPSLVSELELLEGEIKQRKKAQAATYALGKDQVNAMWDSIQSPGAIGLDDEASALLKRYPVDEDDGDEIPSYVSKHTKEVRVAASESYKKPVVVAIDDEDDEPVFIDPDGAVFPLIGSMCSKCGEPQYTTPSGDTCSNGHGGAAALADGEVWSPTIKGTFVKTGDPKPLTVVKDEDSNEVILSEDDVEEIRSVNDLGNNEALQAQMDDIAEQHDNIIFAAPTEADVPVVHVRELRPGDIDPQPSAKELLTQEVITELETVTVAPKKWSLSDVADSIINPTKAVDVEDIPDIEEPIVVQEPIIEDVGDLLNEPEPIATPAPSTPRKKLMLFNEEELF